MTILQQYPVLNKILSNWLNEPVRPPLLINGMSENIWKSLREDIIKIFTEKPRMSDHPDILILERELKKQNIEVKHTRDFISQLSMSSYEYPFKLGFIPSAHHLNVQSQNALLKTLEEPLQKRYLILGTISKNKLLPTILSRSTILNINRNLTETTDSVSLRQEIVSLYEDCLKSSLPQRLEKGQAWSEGKTEKINEFFEFIIPELHKNLVESVKNKKIKTTQTLVEQLKKALDYTEQLGRTSGASPKLLFESFLLGLH